MAAVTGFPWLRCAVLSEEVGVKPFICTRCGRRFHRHRNLLTHQRIHTGRSFVCSKCGRRFHSHRNLLTHQRIHTGRSFVCSKCGRRFHSHRNLLTHQRIHTGRSFVCSKCGKCFSHRKILIAHKWVHTGRKPFTCTECNKEQINHLLRKAKLNVHLKIHTGEKLCVCPHCRKSYTDKYNLSVHLRVHTAGRLCAPSVGKASANPAPSKATSVGKASGKSGTSKLIFMLTQGRNHLPAPSVGKLSGPDKGRTFTLKYTLKRLSLVPSHLPLSSSSSLTNWITPARGHMSAPSAGRALRGRLHSLSTLVSTRGRNHMCAMSVGNAT
uniref:C2H2-type domain-containing protein n=1 Tax=Xenopus tropicalis TaxID=8364 RepID=A0A803K0V4_XENTR